MSRDVESVLESAVTSVAGVVDALTRTPAPERDRGTVVRSRTVLVAVTRLQGNVVAVVVEVARNVRAGAAGNRIAPEVGKELEACLTHLREAGECLKRAAEALGGR